MNTCPHCGKQLGVEAPQGLCPECLLKAGFATEASADGAKAAAYVPPSPAELARYFPQLEIIELLGQGGMGAVYKARQKQLDRLVAVKILPPHISADPAFAERFAREAKALAKLNHPNIVTLYEFGQADGLFYFMMEYVDGMNLRQLMDASRIAPREALAIVPQICDALQYAHDQGIVHRDIKPENILMDRRGQVKVADFGLAKLMELGSTGILPVNPKQTEADTGKMPVLLSTTEAGQVMGTPQYMAPEQREHPSEVDHRADIYSLGVVFYQMLTGELPKGDFAAPSKKVVIDVRLDQVVLRAMEKTPELRYQQVSEVKTMLETIAATLPEQEKSTGSVIPQAHRPRLSRTAIVGFCWVTLFLLAAIWLAILYGESVGSWGMMSTPGKLGFVLTEALFVIGVLSPIGTTILGWIAVRQIRRSNGKVYGLGLALFDGLFFPLLALDYGINILCSLLWVGYLANQMAHHGAFWIPEWCLTGGAVFLDIVVDFLIVRWVWRTACKPLHGMLTSPAISSQLSMQTQVAARAKHDLLDFTGILTFQSRLALNVARIAAVGVLGFLGFIPGWERLFGLFGLFGIIGIAYTIEVVARFRKPQGAAAPVTRPAIKLVIFVCIFGSIMGSIFGYQVLMQSPNAGSATLIEKRLTEEIATQLKERSIRFNELSVILAPDGKTAGIRLTNLQEMMGIGGRNVWTSIDGDLSAIYVGAGVWEVKGSRYLGAVQFKVRAGELSRSAAQQLSFSPVIERVITVGKDAHSFYSFDRNDYVLASTSLELPDGERNRDEFWKWLTANHVDVFARAREGRPVLFRSEMAWKDLNADDFDRLTPTQLATDAGWKRPAFRGQESSLLNRGNLRGSEDTFAFQTRFEVTGLLQVVGVMSDPPGVKIRYKLVQQPLPPIENPMQVPTPQPAKNIVQPKTESTPPPPARSGIEVFSDGKRWISMKGITGSKAHFVLVGLDKDDMHSITLPDTKPSPVPAALVPILGVRNDGNVTVDVRVDSPPQRQGKWPEERRLTEWKFQIDFRIPKNSLGITWADPSAIKKLVSRPPAENEPRGIARWWYAVDTPMTLQMETIPTGVAGLELHRIPYAVVDGKTWSLVILVADRFETMSQHVKVSSENPKFKWSADWFVPLGASAASTMAAGATTQPATTQIASTEATAVAESWIKLLDAGKYGQSWQELAGFTQKAVAQPDWMKSLDSFRKPLGKVVARKLKSADYVTTLPGAPDGQYVVLQFETRFENKRAAIETVTPMKDEDGKWKVSGYYVK